MKSLPHRVDTDARSTTGITAAQNAPGVGLATQVAELVVAAPKVVAHRVGRMAMSAMQHDAPGETEWLHMGAEKLAAFGESWHAMALEICRLNQQLAEAIARSTISPGLGAMPEFLRSAGQTHGAAWSILQCGLAPIHKRAMANAQRIASQR